MVKVYRFQIYDGESDEKRTSRRWATREAIEGIRVGLILEETEVEIDEAHLDGNGMTERDFDPDHRPGFQTRVRR